MVDTELKKLPWDKKLIRLVQITPIWFQVHHGRVPQYSTSRFDLSCFWVAFCENKKNAPRRSGNYPYGASRKQFSDCNYSFPEPYTFRIFT